MSTRTATAAAPRRAAAPRPRRARAARRRCAAGCAAPARGRRRRGRGRRLALAPWADEAVQEVDPAAAPRRHHPPAGRRQGPRPGADRRRHLRRVALPRPDVARRREGPDAADARHRGLHRPEVGRHRVRAGRPRHAAGQHRLRLLVPALPARPLRRPRGRSRSPPTTPGTATSTRWLADAAARRATSSGRDIPFPETRAYVGKVLDARDDYRREYADELGL